MRFDVGCRLRYRVDEANTFVFNIAVADSPCQQVEQERLEIEPDLIVEELRLLEGSRHMRLHAPVGELTLDYQASGTLHPIQADPQGPGEWDARLPGRCIPYKPVRRIRRPAIR